MRARHVGTKVAAILMLAAAVIAGCPPRPAAPPPMPACDDAVFDCIRKAKQDAAVEGDKCAHSVGCAVRVGEELKAAVAQCRSGVVERERRCCPPEMDLCSDGRCEKCGPCETCSSQGCTNTCANSETCENDRCVTKGCGSFNQQCGDRCCPPNRPCINGFCCEPCREGWNTCAVDAGNGNPENRCGFRCCMPSLKCCAGKKAGDTGCCP
jgi:hypothetical protein